MGKESAKEYICIYAWLIHSAVQLKLTFFFSFFQMSTLQHVEVPGLGVESELQLQACTTATATWDLSRISHLHHSLQ